MKTLSTILTSVRSSSEQLRSSTELAALLASTLETCYSAPALRPVLLANLGQLLEHFAPPPAQHPAITSLLLHLARCCTCYCYLS